MTTTQKSPAILVVIGITGDLARRKLLPAIERLAAAGELPEQFQILGVSRRSVTRREVVDALPSQLGHGYPFISKHLRMLQMDLNAAADYEKLQAKLTALEEPMDQTPQRLFYLSVPPQASEPVIELLGQAGFGKTPETKLLLEKPFGSDLDSAKDLFRRIARYFDDEQVFHIDHYMAKEMAQNVVFFREGNSLFKNTWNKDFIERVEIVAAEQLGIEGRVTFYEQTGAMRDFVQSHLLQLAALTLMKTPVDGTTHMQRRRLEALKALQPPSSKNLKQQVIRGQYEGYTTEVHNPHSSTETFVSMTLFSSDKQWRGVPITLITGKGLKTKYTEIRIHYRPSETGEANELKLRFQPREGIELILWSKQPGYARVLERTRLQFNYGTTDDIQTEAHEQVVFDALRADHSLFTSNKEVLASWRILAPVQAAWSQNSNDMIVYSRGSTVEEVLAQAA